MRLYAVALVLIFGSWAVENDLIVLLMVTVGILLAVGELYLESRTPKPPKQ